MTPNFSAYPFERLRRLGRRDARIESVIARWLAARPRGDRLAMLVGGPIEVELVTPTSFDPHAACCEVRIDGAGLEVLGASAAVRAITEKLLGGVPELAAPRPLGVVEQAIWSLVVATALEDLGVPGQVWPRFGAYAAADGIELVGRLGTIPFAARLVVPADLELRVPPPRAPAFELSFDVPIVRGRCALPRASIAALKVRDVITLEGPAFASALELDLFGGVVGLAAKPSAVVAEVVTGYVRRDVSLPDDAHVELAVSLGTTRLSLRQVCDLARGQIISLGRPLAGPFELRVDGRLVGRGELVDVDGELAVRIVSLGDQE